MAYVRTGKVFQKQRHSFWFKISGKEVPKRAKVRIAKSVVDLELKEEHVIRSLQLNGQGDSTNCAGAICGKDHPGAFPHPFTGYIDFNDHSVHVSSKNDGMNFPSECVAYIHRTDVPPLFDTKSGLRQLLDRIKEAGGILNLRLYPPQIVKGYVARTRPKYDRKKPVERRLAHRRIARVKTGL